MYKLYNVEAAGSAGLKSALINMCAKWNGSAFVASVNGCHVGNVSMDNATGDWSVTCDCAVKKTDLKKSATLALVRYTFDRVGRVFDTSVPTEVSLIPVIVAISPIVIALVTLLALQIYARCECTKTTSPDRRTNVAAAVEGGQQDFHFDNPIRPEQAENRRQQFAEQQQRQQQQRDARGPFGFTKGLFRVNTGAHQADAVVEMQNRHAAAASDPNSLCSCLRLPRLRLRLRLIWSGMKESHELLAIFMAQRQPGMGASERLALFLGCLESQLLGATLMYHLNACYTLTSIFEEDAMPLGDWMSARALMMLQTSLFTVPIDLIVGIASSSKMLVSV